MKIPRKKRIASLFLALALATVSFAGYRAQTVYGQEQAYIRDVVELCLGDGQRLHMEAYVNACYEASFTTTEGVNRYTVIKNGKVLEERIVDAYPDTLVRVRYFPYRENKIVDSVNEKSLFKTDGAWVGELTKLNAWRPANAQFKDWYPENESGLLEDMGGGIFQKTFYFTRPLPQAVTLDYKIAFGKGWETPTIGGKDGSNFQMTIPAGTQSISVWADSIAMECVTSIEQGGFQGAAEGGDLGKKPEGSVMVSVAGTFNENAAAADWQLKPMGRGLYGGSFYIGEGQSSYNILFDGQISRSGESRQFSLKQGGYVYFLYDSGANALYDSVNNSGEIESLLHFERPLTPQELDKKAYDGKDLGAVYSPESTMFKVWAPTASAVSVNLYSTGGAGEDSLIASHGMEASRQNGVWSVTVPGDLNGVFYTYSVTIGDKTNETVDLYAKAVGLNGDRGMIINLAETNPAGWESDSFVSRAGSTDAIIWETHVRDFSISSDSGISAANRGKYLAFTETGTTVNGRGGASTGLDHLKELGVSYVHLLPTQDFVNDETSSDYNWGYSTKNYHVPDGSYSTNPADGYCRIREFKEMVQALHQADIGVVMDVVYNHTGDTEDSWFNLTVPGYYYRLDENGDFLDRTLCGNETASERAMFRKYMIDSLIYWAKEYHVDGFRFDLMAIHDTETMNAIRSSLDAAGLSNVILYGEPWYATNNDEELAPGYLASNKSNASALSDRIAMFNSYTRTGIIGGLDGSATGFVQGDMPPVRGLAAEGTDASLLSAIAASSDPGRGTDASPAWSRNPTQSVSYTSCHDDCTLWDWLYNSVYGNPANAKEYGRRDEALLRMNRMAALLNLTSQGSVLFQSGEEFARSKEGDSDSYKSPDRINAIRWSRLEQFEDLSQYYKGLIEIRKSFPAFWDTTTASLNTIQTAEEEQDHFIAYTIQNPRGGAGWNTAAVIVNASFTERTVDLAVKNGNGPAAWAVLADGEAAGLETIRVIEGNTITVPAQTGMILVEAGGSDTALEEAAAKEAESAESPEKKDKTGQKSGKKTPEGVRYFDEDGNSVKGWIKYDKGSRTADHFDGTLEEEDIYYCDSDGYRVTGWQYLWDPAYETEEGLDSPAVLEDEAEMHWFYFQKNGEPCHSEKAEIDGGWYCFDENGHRIDGWVYELAGGAKKSYVGVDKDTPEDVLNGYNEDYSQYMYADENSGRMARSTWLYLPYPGREENPDPDDDMRTFYFDSSGHLETGENAIVKTAITVDELGTYKLRDYSQQLAIIKQDGEYYALDNLAGSIGDVVYLTGGSHGLPDGFYCFKGENNKMLTGNAILKEDDDDYAYYYRFAPEGTAEYRKGQGVTGVYGGKLYYQGLAVGAQEDMTYELVYLPTIAEKRTGATGMFLVDEKGNVKTGRKKAYDDREYRVVKKSSSADKYGYTIYEIVENEDGDEEEILLTPEDAARIYLDDIER